MSLLRIRFFTSFSRASLPSSPASSRGRGPAPAEAAAAAVKELRTASAAAAASASSMPRSRWAHTVQRKVEKTQQPKKLKTHLQKFLCPLSLSAWVFFFLFLCPFFFFCSTRAMRASLASSSSQASSGCLAPRGGFSSRHQQRLPLARMQSRSLAAAPSPSSPSASSPSSSSSSSFSSRPASHLAASTSAPSQPASWRDLPLTAGRAARNILLSGWRPER